MIQINRTKFNRIYRNRPNFRKINGLYIDKKKLEIFLAIFIYLFSKFKLQFETLISEQNSL